MENNTQIFGQREILPAHYYGYAIRRLFIIIGLVMLVTFPFFSNLLPVPAWVSIGLMVLLAVFGGLLNPSQRWLLIANSLLAAVGFTIFEYQTAYSYTHLSTLDARTVPLFWVNQIVSLLFFIGLYLAIKTVRGKYIKNAEW